MRRYRGAWLPLALGLLLPWVAHAQGTSPLRKAELVRLLATGALGKRDIAALVRRNCVTFQPSVHDRTELRAAGADDDVLAAIDQCLVARTRPSALPAPAAPVAPAALRVVTAETVSAAAGTEAIVVVQLVRGTAPEPGVPLQLRGASAVPPSAVTNRRGIATFRVAAGSTAGTYRLSVVLASGSTLSAGGQIALVTTPAQVAGAEADPAEVTQGAVTISVIDRYGNRVSGVPLELRPVTAELAGAFQGTTDERGQAVLTLAPGSVRRAGEVAILSRGTRIGAFSVRPAPQVLSDQGTQFTRGAELRGVVGAPLREPLIFQVRDTAGAPIVGQVVTFAATNGGVASSAAESDSSGALRVRVTLGTRAGPVNVTATVGGGALTRTVTVYADPGPASRLVVERDGASVVDSVTVRSRDTLVLRVAARDAYGNDVALGDFAATTTGAAIALRSASVAGSRAEVRLAPQRTGVGEVQISAAGLHARVSVDVKLPHSAGRGGPWAVGARAAWLGANHPWVSLAHLQGISGPGLTLLGRRTFGSGFSLALSAGVGSLSLDTTGGSVPATLLEGSARVELALLPGRVITPVLSLGGGAYRLKSGENGRAIYHTNLFWTGGVGLDAAVTPTVTAELRVERQWLTDSPAGHVGTLWPVAAGLRVAL